MEDRHVTFELVSNIAKTYGLDVNEMKPLGGYIDKNLLLKCSNGKEYVLRIKIQTFNQQLEEMIDEGLKHFQTAGFQVPFPILTVTGEPRGKCEFSNHEDSQFCYPVHLTPFIPGKTVFDAGFNADELHIISRNVGAFGGLMQNRLMTLNSKKRIRRSDFQVWYTENFPIVREFHGFVENEALRSKLCKLIDRFEQAVTPKLPKLRQAFVHGDYSNTNIVIVDRIQASSQYLTDEQLLAKIGILDFEYFHYGYIVFSLTTCIAYMMSQAAYAGADPIFVAGEILRGFVEKFPLNEDEWDVVFWGVIARLTSSYLMSIRLLSIATDPDEDYIMCQSSKSCELLEILTSLGEAKVKNMWVTK